jgi:PAS domain-containing protein
VYKPSFLTDQELKHLILEAADGFLFVAQCDTGNIIYVSDAVQPVLSFSPNDWSHRSLFDFVHPDDLDKVKDQLSTQENSSTNSTGRVLDLKTGTVKKEGHSNSMRSHIGSRRSFICRMCVGSSVGHMLDHHQASVLNPWSNSMANIRSNRNRNTLQPSTGNSTNESSQDSMMQQQYSVVHVTGYTKMWPPPASTSSSNANNNSSHAHLNGVAGQQQQPNMYNPNEMQQHQQLYLGMHHQVDHQQPSMATGSSSSNVNEGASSSGSLNVPTNFHLIAIARIQVTAAPSDLIRSSNAEFVTRHDHNGLITFVDQKVTSLLGYQPSEMLKKPLSDFLVTNEQSAINEQLKLISEKKITQPIQMVCHFTPSPNYSSSVNSRQSTSQASSSSATTPTNASSSATQEPIAFKTTAYAFCNPCNEVFEFIVCTHVNQKMSEINASMAAAAAASVTSNPNSIGHQMSGSLSSSSSNAMLGSAASYNGVAGTSNQFSQYQYQQPQSLPQHHHTQYTHIQQQQQLQDQQQQYALSTHQQQQLAYQLPQQQLQYGGSAHLLSDLKDSNQSANATAVYPGLGNYLMIQNMGNTHADIYGDSTTATVRTSTSSPASNSSSSSSSLAVLQRVNQQQTTVINQSAILNTWPQNTTANQYVDSANVFSNSNQVVANLNQHHYMPQYTTLMNQLPTPTPSSSSTSNRASTGSAVVSASTTNMSPTSSSTSSSSKSSTPVAYSTMTSGGSATTDIQQQQQQAWTNSQSNLSNNSNANNWQQQQSS